MINEILQQTFPGQKILSCEEFQLGYNNQSYDVKTSSGNYVVKLLRLDPEKKLVLKQPKIKELLPELPLSNIIVATDKYIVLEKIEGQSLKLVYEEVENKEQLFEEIGEFYGKLHSSTFDAYGFFDKDLQLENSYTDWYAHSTAAIEKHLQAIAIDEAFLAKQREFFEQKKEVLKHESSPVLCHGDSSFANMIVRKEQDGWHLQGVIDFEFAMASGMVYDLFKGLRSYKGKRDYRQHLVRGHEKHTKLPDEWEDLMVFYSWLNYIQELQRIPKMKWRNLTEDEAQQRRHDNKNHAIRMLTEIVELHL